MTKKISKKVKVPSIRSIMSDLSKDFASLKKDVRHFQSAANRFEKKSGVKVLTGKNKKAISNVLERC